MDWNKVFSDKASRMRPSAIRELLALTQKPEIISLAGGLPDPKLFPAEKFAESMNKVINEKPGVVLQYGETPGYSPLRETLVERAKGEGEGHVKFENLSITTSSQQGIDLIGKVMISPGDHIIVEGPTYLAAIQAWSVYGAEFETVDMDADGMKVDALEEKLKELDAKGIKPKFIYTIPTFQNPAGYTMPLERRIKVFEIAKSRQIPIIEDNPYGELRFAGENVPSFQSMDKDLSLVVSLRTFSKILCPGLRLGWVIGPAEVINKLNLAKSASDLCPPVVTQAAVHQFIVDGYLDSHIPIIRECYGKKFKTMDESIKEYFPAMDGIHWAKAEGGMFIWVTLPKDTTQQRCSRRQLRTMSLTLLALHSLQMARVQTA